MTTIKTTTSALNAVIVAFRADMKAGKKLAETLDNFAKECLSANITRANAAKLLANAVRKEMLKDPEYVAREAENGKPFTSLKAICRSIENRWTYTCNKLGYSADESNKAKGSRGGKATQVTAAKGSAKTNGSTMESTKVNAAPVKADNAIERSATLKAAVNSKEVMRDLASMVGTLASGERVAVVKMFLDTLTDKEAAALLASYAPKAIKAKKAA